MNDNQLAEIRVWIECARCCRIERPTLSVRVPPVTASPKLEKVSVPCDRCGAQAMMYLQRAATRMP
jgi:hypothetical protein